MFYRKHITNLVIGSLVLLLYFLMNKFTVNKFWGLYNFGLQFSKTQIWVISYLRNKTFILDMIYLKLNMFTVIHRMLQLHVGAMGYNKLLWSKEVGLEITPLLAWSNGKTHFET
jgi:hypothetical protein